MFGRLSRMFHGSSSPRKKKGGDADGVEDPQQEDNDDDGEDKQERQQQQISEEEERMRLSMAEQQKAALLEGQQEREQKASELDQFTKQQRVRYFHKLSDQWIEDAVVVGVHHDDGPDKPYYTIRYVRPEDGTKTEKQTTKDRLEGMKFDPEKTWEILAAKTKR